MKSILPFLLCAIILPELHGQTVITGREPDHVRVLIAGDTCYGESYQEEYARTGGVNILTEKGYNYPVAKLIPLLRAVDFRILNLETPLTTNHSNMLVGKDYVHYSDPVKLPQIFGAFTPLAFSLANNHSLDQGVVGLNDTFAALKGAGIEWFGAGTNLADASQPLLKKIQVGDKTFTLAVFGAFEYRKNYDTDFHFYAGADKPGTASIDLPAARQAITQLRKDIPDAFIIYFTHWGDNYRWKTPAETNIAHALREDGVDLVVGAHAHTMQEVEYDGRGWIFYGVGNFMFNAQGRYVANHISPFSLPLVIDFSVKDGQLKTGLRVYPTVSDNQITRYQPRFVTETELSAVDALLAEKSGWDAASRAAVKRGHDDIGFYLNFLEPKPAR
ncbi:MAG TPA: CapA family protein [Candidatus Sulfotelmatobacter sp.]|jgi:hypothetical protein|nr:CapA family protein [Candidatus Sulfotelmatobacter sp.]